MRTLLISLLFLIGFNVYAQTGADVRTDVVYEKTLSADSAATVSDYFDVFTLYSDTLAFIVEVVEADSLDIANPISGDSLAISVRMLPKSPGGFMDTTTVTYWTTVVSKTATQGRVAFGTNIPLLPSQTYGAKGYITATNTTGGKQKFRIRVYAIRKFNNKRG